MLTYYKSYEGQFFLKTNKFQPTHFKLRLLNALTWQNHAGNRPQLHVSLNNSDTRRCAQKWSSSGVVDRNLQGVSVFCMILQHLVTLMDTDLW